jgi:hypothetical protein
VQLASVLRGYGQLEADKLVEINWQKGQLIEGQMTDVKKVIEGQLIESVKS